MEDTPVAVQEQTLIQALGELLNVPEEKTEELDRLLSRIILEKTGEFLNHKDNRSLMAMSIFNTAAGIIGEHTELRRKLSEKVPVVSREPREGSVRATFTTKEIGGIVLEAFTNGVAKAIVDLPADVENGYRTFAWTNWNEEIGDVIYITFEDQVNI